MSKVYEVEIKFRVANPKTIQEKVESLGGAFDDGVEQFDTYLTHPQRNFKETDEALRIRKIGNEVRVTYKGPRIDKTTKTRRELEFAIHDANEHLTLFELLGFRRVASVRKTRRTSHLSHHGHAFEVCLDQVDGLGSFVELETAASENEVDVARAALLALAAQFGLSDPEHRGYLDLLLADA